MAKSFNISNRKSNSEVADMVVRSKKAPAKSKRDEKRFNGMLGQLRNVDPKHLNMYELTDISQEAVKFRR
jgi:hypothetical protein